MPPLNEVLFLGVVPAVLSIMVLCATFRPWKRSSGGGDASINTGHGNRFEWGKDERRAGALLIGLALIVAQLGMDSGFHWPLKTEHDHRLLVILGATAAALFAPTCKAPMWLSVLLRLAVSTGALWLITFVYRETDRWSDTQAVGYAALMGAGVAVVWTILQRVSERGPAPIAPFAIAALAGAAMPIMTFRAGYISPGQLSSVIALIAGMFFVASVIRSRVTLGSGVGVAVVSLSAMLIDIVRVAAANAYGEPNPVPWWWVALLIASPALAGAAMLPGIKSWHPVARIALAVVLSAAIPAVFAGIALSEADLSAYGLTGSEGDEPVW